MIITGFKVGKRKGGPCAVEFSHGDPLLLDAELIVRFHLHRGMEVDDAMRERLEAEQQALIARRRLVRYLSTRRKTEHEARRYLKNAGFSEHAMMAALTTAKELGLIDDERYATAYRRTQERVGGKGYRAIEHELITKGVAPAVARKALADASEHDYQFGLAYLLAQKRAAALASVDPPVARRRLSAYLMRRGFDPDIVSEVVRNCLGDEENV